MKSGGDQTNRERARIIYLRSGCKKSLQLIAKEIGVSYDTVKSWKRRDKWDDDPKATPKGANAPAPAPEGAPKKGAPKGNKNAVYANRMGNQNAVTTGEYARLLFSDLSEDERALLASIPDCTTDLMRHDLALLCVREKRMLERIASIQRSADNETGLIYSEITSHHSTHVRNGNTDTTDTTDTTVAPAIDRIRDIEEALTRVRREKQRIITALNELEIKRKQLELEEERIAFTTGKLDSDAMPTIINVRPDRK